MFHSLKLHVIAMIKRCWVFVLEFTAVMESLLPVILTDFLS